MICEWDLLQFDRQCAALKVADQSLNAPAANLNDVTKTGSEFDKKELQLVSDATKFLTDFRADKFEFFARVALETRNSNPARPRVSNEAPELIIANARLRERSVENMVRIGKSFSPYPVPVAAVACEALSGLQGEIDAGPEGFASSDVLSSSQIRSLLSLAHRLPFFGPEQHREWMLLFFEFQRDFSRFDAWVKNNHKTSKQHSIFAGFWKALGAGSSNLLKTLQPFQTRTTETKSAGREDALTNTAIESETLIENELLPSEKIGSTAELPVWHGPLVDAEWVSKILRDYGHEKSPQTLKNHYWKAWKPEDHKRGRQFLFYWDRIRPIVEKQFCVKFRD